MDMEKFQSWLDSYRHAWESQNPQTYANLFTDNSTYHTNPFSEPLSGRSTILHYWTNTLRSQEQIQFKYKILAVTHESGIAHWWALFVHISSKTKVKLDGIFVVSLDDENLCRDFKQWWHWLEYS